ncbi:methionine/alanine import family NSS transporter small subunit [Janibacter sp. Soil728]|nr:methionine/alanine import family NSS transporter small subunit [Janibacter sp. Soil728]
MTTTAIIMMIIAMLTIWGGLVAAIVNLTKRGDASAEDVRGAELHRDL